MNGSLRVLAQPEKAAAAIAAALASFGPDHDALAAGFAKDGLATAAFVRAAKSHLGEELAQYFHVGATSQDLIDTAFVKAAQAANSHILAQLSELLGQLDRLDTRFGDAPLMARTRMQAALPTTVRDRLQNWRSPLEALRQEALEFPQKLYLLQLGGPVGTNAAYGQKAQAVSAAMATALNLKAPAHPWHTDRTPIVTYATWLTTISGALAKFGADITLMAQNGIDEVTLSGAGGSSAMAHKRNPILAETLVSQGRYNAAQIGLVHQAMIHEQERSGSAWMLEWMVLPQMAITTGAALRNAINLCGMIEALGSR